MHHVKLLFVITCLVGAVAPIAVTADAAVETEKEQETARPIPTDWEERVAVSAQLEGVSSAPLGASSTVVDPAAVAVPPSNLADAIAEAPGVALNGQGGQFRTYSIRGVSRQRVLSLVDGMRVTSERRAGVSTSFLDPLLIGSIEVIRGPATTFYGSGALGGVVQAFTRSPEAPFVATGYGDNGNSGYLAYGSGGATWSGTIVHRRADDSESAAGAQIHDGFEQTGAVVEKRWTGDRRSYELTLIPTLGRNIAKANRDFPQRTTDYPLERHGLVRFGVTTDHGRRAVAYLHAHDLETRVFEAGDSGSRVFNETLDFGASFVDLHPINPSLSLRFGTDLIGRSGVNSEELNVDLTPVNPDPPSRIRTLDDGSEAELGAWAALRGTHGKTRWESGARLTWQHQGNRGFDSTQTEAVSGFAGISHEFNQQWRIQASVSSGLRLPSLTEKYFSGTTGRGDVIGNPDLNEERSLTGEIGLHWANRRATVQGTLFRTEIDNYIERVEVAPGLLTFVNLTQGAIEGVELQGLVDLSERWFLTWGGHTMEGRAEDGSALADVAADQLFGAISHHRDRWTFDARWTHRFSKGDPGSGEEPIDSAEIVSGDLRYRATATVEWILSVNNLLDRSYLPTADDTAEPARGRAVEIGLRWGL